MYITLNTLYVIGTLAFSGCWIIFWLMRLSLRMGQMVEQLKRQNNTIKTHDNMLAELRGEYSEIKISFMALQTNTAWVKNQIGEIKTIIERKH